MIIDRRHLLNALEKMTKIAGPLDDWSRQEGFHLVRMKTVKRKLFMMATNGSTWVTTVLITDGDLDLAVPIKDLIDVLDEQDEYDTEVAQVKNSAGVVGLRVDDASVVSPEEDDGPFPMPEKGDWRRKLEVNLEDYADYLRYLARVGTPRDSGKLAEKEHIAQVLFDESRGVMTDGHRMHLVRGFPGVKRAIRIDLDTYLFLVSVLEDKNKLVIDVDKDMMRIRTGHWSIECEYPAHKFLAYREVIPSVKGRQDVIVNREDILHVISTMMEGKEDNAITLRIMKDMLRLYGHDEKHEVKSTQYADTLAQRNTELDFKISFKTSYLIDALSGVGENVKISFSSGEAANQKSIIVDSGAGQCAILMPLKL